MHIAEYVEERYILYIYYYSETYINRHFQIISSWSSRVNTRS